MLFINQQLRKSQQRELAGKIVILRARFNCLEHCKAMARTACPALSPCCPPHSALRSATLNANMQILELVVCLSFGRPVCAPVININK